MALPKRHNNKLPKRYACSDTRHRWMYQYHRNGRPIYGGRWYCFFQRCPNTKDATLARFAILNF